jgi:hypothetical protein
LIPLIPSRDCIGPFSSLLGDWVDLKGAFRSMIPQWDDALVDVATLLGMRLELFRLDA